jgi:hypothetical protein
MLTRLKLQVSQQLPSEVDLPPGLSDASVLMLVWEYGGDQRGIALGDLVGDNLG